jgi:putative membrane protein
MENLILVVKGFFMGIANVIPGVSGGTIAIILGIYEKFIGANNVLDFNWAEDRVQDNRFPVYVTSDPF